MGIDIGYIYIYIPSDRNLACPFGNVYFSISMDLDGVFSFQIEILIKKVLKI